MYKIYHAFDTEGTPEEVFPLIATTEGLNKWWPLGVKGDASEGGTLTFSFGTHGTLTMKVIRVIQDESVLWACSASTFQEDEAWDGTEVSIHLNPDDGFTLVRFEHENWKEEDEYFAMCNFIWGQYLARFKSACEAGKGEPSLA